MSVSSNEFDTLVDDDFEEYTLDNPTNQTISLALNSPLHQFRLDEPAITNQSNHLSTNRFDAEHRRASSTANLDNVIRQWSEQSSNQSSPSNASVHRRKNRLTSPIRRSFGLSMGLNVQDTLSGRASPVDLSNRESKYTSDDNHLTVETELSDDDIDFSRPANHSNRFSSSLMRLRSLTRNKSPRSINHSQNHTPSALSNGRESPSINQSVNLSINRSVNEGEEIESPFEDDKGIPNFHTEDSKTHDDDRSPSVNHTIFETAKQSNNQPIHSSTHNPFAEPDEAKTASPINQPTIQVHKPIIATVSPTEQTTTPESHSSHRSDHVSAVKSVVISKPQTLSVDRTVSPSVSPKKSDSRSIKSASPISPVTPIRSKTPEPVSPQPSKPSLSVNPSSPSPLSPVSTATKITSTPKSTQPTKVPVTPSSKQSTDREQLSALKSASPAPAQLSLSDLDDQSVKQKFQGKFVTLTKDILQSLQHSNIGERVEAAASTLTDCLIKFDALSINQTIGPASPMSRSFGAASRRQLVFIPSQSFNDDQATSSTANHSPLPLSSETSLASAPRLDVIKAFAQLKQVYQSPRSWLVSELLVGIHESITRSESDAAHLCALFACISELMARFETVDQPHKQPDNQPINQLFRSFAVPFPTSWAYHPTPVELSTFTYPANSSLTINQFLLLELLDARASAFQCVLAQAINQWQALPDPTSSYQSDVDGSWLEPYFTTLTEFDSYARHAHWTAFERAQLLGCSMYSLIAHVLSSVVNAPELSMQDGIKLKILASTLQDFAQRLTGDAGVQAMESAGLAGLRDLGLLLLLEKSDIDLNMVQMIAPSLDLLTIHRICFTFMQTEGNEPVSPELLAQISQALAALDEDQQKQSLPTEAQCLLLINWNSGNGRQAANEQTQSTEFDAVFHRHPEFNLIRQ